MAPIDETRIPIDPELLNIDRAARSASRGTRSTSVTNSTVHSSSPRPHGSTGRGTFSFEDLQSRIEALEALETRVETIEGFLKGHNGGVESLGHEVESLLGHIKRLSGRSKQHTELIGRHDELLKQHEKLLTEHSELQARLSSRINDADDDADDEDEGYQSRRKRKKPEQTVNKVLTKGAVADLTVKQKKVRKELLTMIAHTLKELAGIKDDSIVPPFDLPPGLQRHEGEEIYTPDFTKDVTNEANKGIIDQAAYLVYRDQSDLNSSTLKFKDVPFTEEDIDDLTKASFKAWKIAYLKKTDDSAKVKAALQAKKTMRIQRKRQKKLDRLSMKEKYLVKYNADPSPLLLTDWTSDYLSGLEDGDDNEKEVHRIKMRAKAGLKDLVGGNEIVWERVRPGFRSDKINEVYERLDNLRAETLQEGNKKKVSIKRVDLGRVTDRLPLVAPFPFMIDEGWYNEFVRDKTINPPFQKKKRDPMGFGSSEIMEEAVDEDMVSSDNRAA